MVALELLEHLETAYRGSAVAGFLAALRAAVAADRQELEALLERLQTRESHSRQALAWFGEGVELKLQFDDSATGAMRLLEGLEVLSLGIEGKHSLWLALATVAEDILALQGGEL